MIDALSTPRNRIKTLILLVICGFLAFIATVVGISDNPPGIILAYGAAIAFVLAFVHPWRTVKQFRLLLYTSLLGLVIFGILHNVFEAVAGKAESTGALQSLLQGLGVVAFLLAVLICPPAILVSAVGSVVMFIRNRRRSTEGHDKVA
jgi:hypothetical protein